MSSDIKSKAQAFPWQEDSMVNNMENFSHLTVSQNYGTTLRNHSKAVHSSWTSIDFSAQIFKSLIHLLKTGIPRKEHQTPKEANPVVGHIQMQRMESLSH